MLIHEARAENQRSKLTLSLSDQEAYTVLQILTVTWGGMTKVLDLPMVGK